MDAEAPEEHNARCVDSVGGGMVLRYTCEMSSNAQHSCGRRLTIALLGLHLLAGLQRLLYQPLHHGEDANVVETLNLVRLEPQRAS